MRFQDLEAAEDLLEEAADADSGHLTLARVGEDRRESQVASRQLSWFAEMQEWLHHAVGRTKPGEDGVKLRLRLWSRDNRPVRGVTFQVWGERAGIAETEEAQSPETVVGLPVVHGGAGTATLQSTEGRTAGIPPEGLAPSMGTCPSCMMLQAGLLAARVEVAQLAHALRHAEDRLWRAEQEASQVGEAQERTRHLEEQNRALTRELKQYERALARANRDLERKSAYLRNAKIVADYVNNTV